LAGIRRKGFQYSCDEYGCVMRCTHGMTKMLQRPIETAKLTCISSYHLDTGEIWTLLEFGYEGC
jgi:hypothetical protein